MVVPRTRRLIVVIALALVGQSAIAAAPKVTPASPPTRPDPRLWTMRHVEAIRAAAEDPRDGGEGAASAIGFAFANPLIVCEPYAGQVLEITEFALKRPDLDENIRRMLTEQAKYYRLPEGERMLRALMRKPVDDREDGE
jgi:hypothetical protein